MTIANSNFPYYFLLNEANRGVTVIHMLDQYNKLCLIRLSILTCFLDNVWILQGEVYIRAKSLLRFYRLIG